MVQQYLQSAQFETIRTVAFGGIGAAYAVFGIPLANTSRYLNFKNTTDQPVFISTNGVNNHLFLAANSFEVIDISTNRSIKEGLYFPQGTQFWVIRAAAAPTVGAVWLSTIFAG
jgi:hypothetical protein